MHVVPPTILDFIAANFEDPAIRAAKTQAAQKTLESLRADELGDMFPDELNADICQALLSDGDEMVVKLSVAVRDCINREDEASYRPAPTSESPLIPEITEQRGAELTALQDAASVADQAVMDSAGVFKALGQIEGLEFVRHVADVAAAQAFEKIKKNKAYKNIPFVDASGNRRHVADLEEFCQEFLGKSARRVRELAQNLHVLGPNLYESAERIGFTARDYRALKALPAEEQEVVKTALASESREEVLGILQDMAASHQSQREASKKETDDLRADLEARDKVLADKRVALDKVQMELAKLKSLPPDEQTELKLAREEETVKQLQSAFMAALSELNKFLALVGSISETDGLSAHTWKYAVEVVRGYCESVNAALADYAIPVDFEEMVSPSWARNLAKTDLESGNTEAQG